MPTKLDKQIQEALQRIATENKNQKFDYDAYIKAFQGSARKKAQAVLDLLDDAKSPFKGLRPVFVSIGGGDGEEIRTLLASSTARRGILVEKVNALADAAREKTSVGHATLRVLEGDAQEKTKDAINLAHQYVNDKEGDFVAVSCHAVLHELFDRSREEFDPLAFFSDIFSDPSIGTWFTYREPGVPEKWPNTVLISANCDSQSLLKLSGAITMRHKVLRDLTPAARVIGDHLRVHRTLGMEMLAKLFYLHDLNHEIEERSTSVDHIQLTSQLWLALGKKADSRVQSLSQPTDSFVDLWQDFGVQVFGLGDGGAQYQLSIAESQTRVLAWRNARTELPEQVTAPINDPIKMEIEVTRRAFKSGDFAASHGLRTEG